MFFQILKVHFFDKLSLCRAMLRFLTYNVLATVGTVEIYEYPFIVYKL
jgi:hypothetical protein